MNAASESCYAVIFRISKPQETCQRLRRGIATFGTVLKMSNKVNERRMDWEEQRKGRTARLAALYRKLSGSELRALAKADRIRAGQEDYESACTTFETASDESIGLRGAHFAEQCTEFVGAATERCGRCRFCGARTQRVRAVLRILPWRGCYRSARAGPDALSTGGARCEGRSDWTSDTAGTAGQGDAGDAAERRANFGYCCVPARACSGSNAVIGRPESLSGGETAYGKCGGGENFFQWHRRLYEMSFGQRGSGGRSRQAQQSYRIGGADALSGREAPHRSGDIGFWRTGEGRGGACG